MYNRAESPNKAMAIFSQLTRIGSKDQSKFLKYIAEPTINYFWDKKDAKNAFKALNISGRAVRSNPYYENRIKEIKKQFEDELKAEKLGIDSAKKKSSRTNTEPDWQ